MIYLKWQSDREAEIVEERKKTNELRVEKKKHERKRENKNCTITKFSN